MENSPFSKRREKNKCEGKIPVMIQSTGNYVKVLLDYTEQLPGNDHRDY